MEFYEELLNQKENGATLNLNDLGKNELRKLFYEENHTDKGLAKLFNTTSSKIQYKRKVLGITIKNMLLEDLMENKGEKFEEENTTALSNLMVKENIDVIAKAITHFAFRNGPIEDMHANSQLSQKDMKTLNKFMVNRFSYFLVLLIENRGLELDFLIKSHGIYGKDWDVAEPDDGGMKEVIKEMMKRT